MTRPLLALVLSLAACAPMAPLPGPGGGTGDACGASRLGSLLGRPASAVAPLGLTTPYRIIRPGDAVTMDFAPARLNFELDAAGRIVRIYCG